MCSFDFVFFLLRPSDYPLFPLLRRERGPLSSSCHSNALRRVGVGFLFWGGGFFLWWGGGFFGGVLGGVGGWGFLGGGFRVVGGSDLNLFSSFRSLLSLLLSLYMDLLDRFR